MRMAISMSTLKSMVMTEMVIAVNIVTVVLLRIISGDDDDDNNDVDDADSDGSGDVHKS